MTNNLPNLNRCTVAVIGLGYVGLPLALELSKVKKCIKSNNIISRKIIGFDISSKRIEELKNNYKIIENNKPNESNNYMNILFSDDEIILKEADVYIIAVPTPIDNARRPDFSALKIACKFVGKAIKEKKYSKSKAKNFPDPIVVFESTVYPGATEEICIPTLEASSEYSSNATGGFFFGYSPERINPGDNNHQLTSIKKIVSGCNENVANWLESFYGSFILAGIHKASSVKVAEAAKVIENTQRDLNIALVNELAVICDLLRIDTSEVIDAACTKWNFHDFRPGLVGGHCIGIDPYYLTHKAEQLGYHPEVVLAGRRINDNMSKWVGQKLILELSKRNLFLKNSQILILGLTYKANCPDLRNSKVVNLINFLVDHNIDTVVVDPVADQEIAKEIYSINLQTKIPSNKKFTAVLLAVAHNDFIDLSETSYKNLIVSDGFFFDLCNCLSRSLKPIRI